MSEIKKIDDLIEKYPELFKRNDKITLRFGSFECGDGWYDILDTWCKLVKSACENHVRCNTPKSFKYNFIYGIKSKIRDYDNLFKKINPKYNPKKYDRDVPYKINRFIIGAIYDSALSVIQKKYNKCYSEHVRKIDKVKTVYPFIQIVKEKFGALNIQGVDWDEVPEYNADQLYSQIRNYEAFAESISSKICETSGNKGFPCSNGGWYKTLSEEEMTKQKYRKTK